MSPHRRSLGRSRVATFGSGSGGGSGGEHLDVAVFVGEEHVLAVVGEARRAQLLVRPDALDALVDVPVSSVGVGADGLGDAPETERFVVAGGGEESTGGIERQGSDVVGVPRARSIGGDGGGFTRRGFQFDERVGPVSRLSR